MTIIYTDGDILMDSAEANVIPVNTVGVPSAGLANAWAKKDPESAGVYNSRLLKKKRFELAIDRS
jgi:hypothetical protein